jgi:hypothetical protein
VIVSKDLVDLSRLTIVKNPDSGTTRFIGIDFNYGILYLQSLDLPPILNLFPIEYKIRLVNLLVRLGNMQHVL